MARGLLALAFATITLGLGAGCHSPGGGMFPSPSGSLVYYSHETRPVSVTVVDVRNGDVIFSMDVPAGKQLAIDFERDAGTDAVYLPDVMRYEVVSIGTKWGKLDNQISVPPANARRVDIDYRDAPEYRPAPAAESYRVDQTANRPEWWTEEGGEMPDDDAAFNTYDE